MPKMKQPSIKVPASYRKHRQLVAIPETEFAGYRRYLEECDAFDRVAEAEHDLKTGNYVVAASLDEALEKFRAGTLGSGS